tara:strand:+ start:1189 stop:2412 length:1224 start_codon:yes stop_codon:yes gene_type:complete
MNNQLRPHQQRALDAMSTADLGQIIVPTGGGKTFIMISHAKQLERGSTVIVVAPRILLARQLCEDFRSQIDAKIFHAHSGYRGYQGGTDPNWIQQWWDTNKDYTRIIFTTYHSLHRVMEAQVYADVVYCDEAHNSCAKTFYDSIFELARFSGKRYYFTATPRVSRKHSRGMHNEAVYGTILCNVEAQELIKQGTILPPTIVPFETDGHYSKEKAHVHHAITITNIIDELDDDKSSKVLVSVPKSRVLNDMLSRTILLHELKDRGYHVLHVTSKFGAYVDGKKVSRSVFMNTLKEWGCDDSIRFVCFHYSILSEGINVPGLTHTILLRYLNVVEMAQTVGRVIRLHTEDREKINNGELQPCEWAFYKKPTGYVTVPVHPKYGAHVVKRLQKVVDSIFIEGVPPISLIT